ncbi:DUF5618 family protein [Persicitalea sp.]|uniref:DUF5618 family protein n=1 Tax=Persicitalea sp. TaxID=3100273 RepID=UPI003592FB5E
MDRIEEAKQHLSNAREMLSEKGRKEDGLYKDIKYVKMAGHTAYAGVLVALDELLGKKTKGRKDVEWYKQQLAELDKKLFLSFVGVYDTLHLSMSYDGNPVAGSALAGLEEAAKIIDWVERRRVAA